MIVKVDHSELDDEKLKNVIKKIQTEYPEAEKFYISEFDNNHYIIFLPKIKDKKYFEHRHDIKYTVLDTAMIICFGCVTDLKYNFLSDCDKIKLFENECSVNLKLFHVFNTNYDINISNNSSYSAQYSKFPTTASEYVQSSLLNYYSNSVLNELFISQFCNFLSQYHESVDERIDNREYFFMVCQKLIDMEKNYLIECIKNMGIYNIIIFKKPILGILKLYTTQDKDNIDYNEYRELLAIMLLNNIDVSEYEIKAFSENNYINFNAIYYNIFNLFDNIYDINYTSDNLKEIVKNIKKCKNLYNENDMSYLYAYTIIFALLSNKIKNKLSTAKEILKLIDNKKLINNIISNTEEMLYNNPEFKIDKKQIYELYDYKQVIHSYKATIFINNTYDTYRGFHKYNYLTDNGFDKNFILYVQEKFANTDNLKANILYSYYDGVLDINKKKLNIEQQSRLLKYVNDLFVNYPQPEKCDNKNSIFKLYSEDDIINIIEQSFSKNVISKFIQDNKQKYNAVTTYDNIQVLSEKLFLELLCFIYNNNDTEMNNHHELLDFLNSIINDKNKKIILECLSKYSNISYLKDMLLLLQELN